jgi:hypothetical protein
MNSPACSKALGKFIIVFLLFGFLTSSSSPTLAAPIPQAADSIEGVMVALEAGHKSIKSRGPVFEPLPEVEIQNATFSVTYVGPWSPAARNAFQHAMNIWASKINSTVPIQVVAEWKPLGADWLVTGGTTRIFVNFPGAPKPNTWYPVALANQFAGVDLMPDGPDINVVINSDFSWYLGTDGNSPPDQFDLVTSGLAGLGYGLGFFSSMQVSDGQGGWGWGTGSPYTFDHFVVNASGQKLVNTNLFPNPSSALAVQLTSANLFFDGPNARAANGGTKPRLYAPSTWQSGLSIGHLDENTYPPGDPNSLMTPFLNWGEAIHDPGPIALGIFEDVGWESGPVPPSPILQGDLQLHMLEAVPPNAPVQPYVTVINTNPTPADYYVAIQLWQGFGIISEQSRDVSFAWSGTQSLTFDFGLRAPGSYYFRAELWHGEECLDVETHSFTVGLDYLKLKEAASGLSNAAYNEINEGEDIATEALSKAAATGVSETTDTILDHVLEIALDVLPGLQVLLPDDVRFAIEELVGMKADFAAAIELGTYDSIYSFFHNSLDRNTFNGRRDNVRVAESALLNYAVDQTFTWDPAWEAELARRKEAISSKNETVGGLGITLSFDPPFVHRASLIEMKGQFDWINETLLPIIETVSKSLLIGFVAVLIIAVIIVLLPISAIPPALLAAVITVAKFVAAALPMLLSWFFGSETTKFVIATVVLALFAFGIAGAAESITSLEVVNEHQYAMDYLWNGVSGELSGGAIHNVGLSVVTQGHTAGVTAALEQEDGPTWFEMQLFRGDGQLLEVADYGMANSDAETSLSRKLPAGPYWAVAVAHANSDTKAHRTVFQIASASVALDLVLSDPQLILGETLEATVTITNQDPISGTGTLVLSAKTLENEGVQIWLPELGPNESVSYSYTFKPEHEGSYVLRATLADEMGTTTRVDRGFVVGDAAAVTLHVSPQISYPPGQDIVWSVTANNAGTRPATVTVALNTYDRDADYALVFNTAHTLAIDGGASSTFNLTALLNAAPGAYSTHLMLGNQTYSIDDFIVEAEGTLFAMLEAEPIATSTGGPVTLTVRVQDETYAPTSANVLIDLRTPSGNLLRVPLVEVETGRYEGSYLPDISGTYVAEVIASKLNYVSATDDTFFIADSASTLLVEAEGGLAVNVPTLLSFRVYNERQIPVPNATIIVSGAHGVVTGKTDSAGTERLLLQPISTDPVTVEVEKSGFADSSLQLPVTAIVKTYLPVVLRNYSTRGH